MGFTSLHFVIIFPEVSDNMSESIEIVKLLVKYKVDVNEYILDTHTPLGLLTYNTDFFTPPLILSQMTTFYSCDNQKKIDQRNKDTAEVAKIFNICNIEVFFVQSLYFQP